MSNMTGQQKLHATAENYRQMLALVCRKRLDELKAEAAYDKAFSEAMLGDAGNGRTKELREAAADIDAWKQKVAYDLARSERISAETSLKMAKSRMDELTMTRDMLIRDIDVNMLFEGWSDVE